MSEKRERRPYKKAGGKPAGKKKAIAPQMAVAPVAAQSVRCPADPAMGMESEFTVVLDGQPVKPEEVFRTPRDFMRVPLIHRMGRSYQLPTGGAVYFDTGVIEVATPIIELGPACAARAGRSLWESIGLVRSELDAWQEREGREIKLGGFSTHVNVSFDLPEEQRTESRTEQKLALLLTYILPFPVMLMGGNRESTGVGCRPRPDRIEVTADFTPEPALAIASATVMVGIIREVMRWPSYDLACLSDADFPVVRDFVPVPHSSRKGWVASWRCFEHNPFTADVDTRLWRTRGGNMRSTRDIARRVIRSFWPSIRQYAHPLTLHLIVDVLAGRTKSLLELPRRPDAYDDVGHACCWNGLFNEKLSRSRYEKGLLCAISKTTVSLEGDRYITAGMRGWSHVVLVRASDGERVTVPLDELIHEMEDPGTGILRTNT
jgi:hypothetical protein